MSGFLASCFSMHPIGVFALKSPSAYTRARTATSPISVNSLNVTSSYLVNSPFATFTPCMLIYLPSCPVRKYRDRTPKPSEHPSRPSFEVVKDEVKVDITQAPRNHRDAKDHVSE